MNLNHIQLPAFAVADLYRSSLVDSSLNDSQPGENAGSEENGNLTMEVPPDAEKESEKDLKWLGNNHKNILVIVAEAEAVHLPDDLLSFLMDILAACNMSLGDIALLNRNNQPGLSYKELGSQFRSRNILLFGVEPSTLGLPLNFPYFQLQTFANISYLYTPSLKELKNDRLLKSKLWVCLKRLFGI